LKSKNNNLKEKHLLFKIALKYWYIFLLGMGMTYVFTQVVVEGNALIAKAVDTLIDGKEVEFGDFIVQLGIMTIIGFVTAYIATYSSSIYSAKVLKRFKDMAAERIIHLQYKYFDEQGSGGIINKLVSDINETDRFFKETLSSLMSAIIIVATVLVYMFGLDWKIFLVVVLCYPILLFSANIVAKKLQGLAKTRRGQLDERTEIAYDNIQGIVVGRSYNLHDIQFKRIDRIIEAVFKNEKRRTSISSLSYVIQSIISWIPSVVCSLFALYEVLHGTISVGDMLAFTILLNRMARPMEEIPFAINDIMEIGVSMKRLDELCSQPKEPSGETDYTAQLDSISNGNAIEFSNINFAYESDTPIFRNLSFTIPVNKTIAFVGGSGEGKSTVFKLICGFYYPQGGSYRLFGEEFSKWDISAARSQFSLVSQNVFLLPETIEENVAYGRLGATHEEIVEACKNANIHDFIMSLPDGYQTQVGERGVRMSGGERQRISIARAFLKNAPVLLLDEPTSAVDVGTEEAIQEAIDRVCKGKTVIIIAHRLNTIMNSDQIMVFQDGSIVETGTHDQLLQHHGVYESLYGKEQKNEA
jgi:ABC-type multidrug transport system fused ATPase/permease subunit